MIVVVVGVALQFDLGSSQITKLLNASQATFSQNGSEMLFQLDAGHSQCSFFYEKSMEASIATAPERFILYVKNLIDSEGKSIPIAVPIAGMNVQVS